MRAASLLAPLLAAAAAAMVQVQVPVAAAAFASAPHRPAAAAVAFAGRPSAVPSGPLSPPPPPAAAALRMSSEKAEVSSAPVEDGGNEDEDGYEDEDEDDYVINIKAPAMARLLELKSKQDDPAAPLVLRMGVRSGGCSGMSYVMDFTTAEDVTDDDEVDDYPEEGIRCIVDAKSLLYLYGLELDFSDELIGGGFKFFNPNAEESCGCGSSFGV